MIKGISLRLIPALMAVAFSGGASAAGFQLLEQNASGIGNAYAGSAASAENASTIFYNPAGMTQLQAREFSVGVTAVNPSFKFSNGSSNTGALTNTGNGGDGGGWGVIPNAYLSWALNKDLYVGLGIGAPFGLKTEYNNPWIGAAQSRKFEIKTININPSIAYRVNETVSLGFGLDWQKLDAEYVRTAGIFTTAQVGVPLSTTPVRLKLDDDAWGWNVGALFNVSPATKVGISYRSSIKFKTTGDITLSGPSAAFNASRTGAAKATIELPDTAILSATHNLNDRWELLGDISWTGWSSIPKVDIFYTTGTLAQTLDTKFRDTWRYAVGANYRVNEAWKLKLGLAYDQTPVPNKEHRLVSLPDNDRTWFSIGAQWKPSKQTAVDFGAAYLYVKDAKIHNNQGTTPGTSAMRGLVDGTFKDNAWILGAQYSQSF